MSSDEIRQICAEELVQRRAIATPHVCIELKAGIWLVYTGENGMSWQVLITWEEKPDALRLYLRGLVERTALHEEWANG